MQTDQHTRPVRSGDHHLRQHRRRDGGVAGQRVFEALGVTDNMGYSRVGGHDHCQFPSSQQSDLSAYIAELLLGQDGNIGVIYTDGGYSFDESKWVDWATPTIQ